MNKTELQSLLVRNLAISEAFAKSAADRLIGCSEKKFVESVINYANTGNKTYLKEDNYDTDLLQSEYSMDYLNAVLMLVWLVTDPRTAKSALDSGYDDITE